jgi:hypothetical protein
MATLLAKKSGSDDNAIAKDDDHHEAMASDPAITAVPQGSTFGGTSNVSTATSTTGFSSGSSAFGAPSAGGFGSTSSFGSSTPASTGFGSSSSFGAPTSVSENATNNTGVTQMAQQNQVELLKSSGGAIQEGAENKVALDKDATDWINKKMRPMMGWIYMLTCTCDFVIFPILWSLLQALSHGAVTSQWNPLTLQGAGLYHIAMGAVLGIAAYGRTKEKVAGVA